jgi:predicted DNA-binding transcriptional regulator AlpA
LEEFVLPADADLLLTLDEVAELLKLEPSSVYSLTRARSKSRPHPLPVIKIAKKLRFRRSSVLAWLADMEASRG